MSGSADPAVQQPLRADGDATFLAKPFGPAALARKMRDLLDAPAAPATT